LDFKAKKILNNVLVFSNAGHRVPNMGNPILNVYPASKYAVTALTESLRQELNFLKTKIRVSVSFCFWLLSLLEFWSKKLILFLEH